MRDLAICMTVFMFDTERRVVMSKIPDERQFATLLNFVSGFLVRRCSQQNRSVSG